MTLAEAFRGLHVPGTPLLMPNPWDVGSAVVLQHLGFRALATTSSGFAATVGRLDGAIARDQTLTHCAALVAAVDVPVSADLEHGFGTTTDEVAATVGRAVDTGLAGLSIEDWSGTAQYPVAEAADRVRAAVEAAAGRVVVTGRAENAIRGSTDLADIIARLQAYQEAGADVLYAPGLTDLADVRRVVSEVDRPVNVLARPGLGSVAALAAAGVARISVGGSFAYLALAALGRAAQDLLIGDLAFLAGATAGGALADDAFGS